jgi:hypothetical protein
MKVEREGNFGDDFYKNEAFLQKKLAQSPGY